MSDSQDDLQKKIDRKAKRKLKARKERGQGVWFGLGAMGLIGWSIVVPTLMGAALGIWLDKNYPGSQSWTLALLVGGLALGCINAWLWISKEDSAIHEDRGSDDE